MNVFLIGVSCFRTKIGGVTCPYLSDFNFVGVTMLPKLFVAKTKVLMKNSKPSRPLVYIPALTLLVLYLLFNVSF